MIKALAGQTSKRLIQTSLSSRAAVGRSSCTKLLQGNAISTIRKSTTAAITPILGTKCNDYQAQNLTWMKTMASIAAAGALVASGIMDYDKTDCCGIVGVVGSNQYDAR